MQMVAAHHGNRADAGDQDQDQADDQGRAALWV
jgi:hypothetical protein